MKSLGNNSNTLLGPIDWVTMNFWCSFSRESLIQSPCNMHMLHFVQRALILSSTSFFTAWFHSEGVSSDIFSFYTSEVYIDSSPKILFLTSPKLKVSCSVIFLNLLFLIILSSQISIWNVTINFINEKGDYHNYTVKNQCPTKSNRSKYFITNGSTQIANSSGWYDTTNLDLKINPFNSFVTKCNMTYILVAFF